jgi:TrmH family RNA methyltransferase
MPPAFRYSMITSPANPKVTLVQRLQTSRHARHRQGLLVAEGARLVGDALDTGIRPRFVLCTASWLTSLSGQRVQHQAALDGFPCLVVTPEILAQCADTDTPQGVLAVFPIPRYPRPVSTSLTLIIDQLRDPGNLGTILRTAAAAGADMVLLPPGNADPFSPKVIRAAMGAHFRLPIFQVPYGEIGAWVTPSEVRVAAAGKGSRYDQVDWTQPVVLVVGGEASGVGSQIEQLATSYVHIPMPGGCESLNASVAAGILLFEAVRQRTGGHLPAR